MRTSLALPAVLLALLTFGCGGSDPAALTDSGYAALNSGKPGEAKAAFEEALADLDPNSPEYLRASLGLARARAAEDPAGAKDAFLAIAEGGGVTAVDYRQIVGDLANAGAFAEATEVLEAGMKAFPEDPRMQEVLHQVGKAAERAGAADALQGLKGLGYIGEDH